MIDSSPGKPLIIATHAAHMVHSSVHNDIKSANTAGAQLSRTARSQGCEDMIQKRDAPGKGGWIAPHFPRGRTCRATLLPLTLSKSTHSRSTSLSAQYQV